MVDDFFKRTWLALGFFWLGMKYNGSNHHWNPIWRMFSRIFQAEMFVLTNLFWAVVAGALIYGLILLFQFLEPVPGATAETREQNSIHKREEVLPPFRGSIATAANC